jgi:hypothetical protein
MNKKQREGAAKYLYDISKGIALVAIVGNFTRETWDIINIVAGGITTVVFFIWAHILQGGNDNA